MKQQTTKHEQGFTLVELMIALLMASVIMAGLFLNFTSQSRQYKYEDKRGDAAQELEFTLRYIARDIESALILTNQCEATGTGACGIQYDGAPGVSTSYLTMQVWDESLVPPASGAQASRCYIYRWNTAQTLFYERCFLIIKMSM